MSIHTLLALAGGFILGVAFGIDTFCMEIIDLGSIVDSFVIKAESFINNWLWG